MALTKSQTWLHSVCNGGLKKMPNLIHQARAAYGSHKAAYTAIGVSRRAWYYYAKGHPMPTVVERSIQAHLALIEHCGKRRDWS